MSLPTTKQPVIWIASIVVLFLSVGLELYGHACGFLITPDSLQYLSAAKSFSESGKILSPDGSYYSYWGPLFPIILSFFKEPQSALVWINVVCKIFIVVALASLACSFLNDSILRVVFLVVSMIGVHVALISVFVWSELIFMTLILWNAHFIVRFKKHPSSFYWFLVTGFLACLQRDAGFFWAGGVCLWLLINSSTSLKVRIIQSAICFFGCTVGLITWRIYINLVMHQNSNLLDYSFFHHTFENVQPVLLTFGKMLLPLNGFFGIVVGSLFFLLLIYGSFYKVNPNRNIQLLGIIISVYALGFIALPWQWDATEMDRFFSVITPLVYLFLLSIIYEKMQYSKQITRVLIYAIVLIWICYPVTRTFLNAKAWHERSCLVSLNK